MTSSIVLKLLAKNAGDHYKSAAGVQADLEKCLQRLKPGKKHSIDFLMAEDPEFLALCEDYDACIDALRYWARSKAPEAKTRVIEYCILQNAVTAKKEGVKFKI